MKNLIQYNISKNFVIKITIYFFAAAAVFLLSNALEQETSSCYDCYHGGIYYASLFILVCFLAEYLLGRNKIFHAIRDFALGIAIAIGSLLLSATIVNSRPSYVPDFDGVIFNMFLIMMVSVFCFVKFKKTAYEKLFLGIITGALVLPVVILMSAFIGL